jgi:hypothetical protein
MSMMNRPARANDLGEMVASSHDYEVAQKTVSKLIEGDVPARDIAIVGQGVRTVERVTGRLGYAAAARSGAVNGVLIGLVLSAIMLFGNPKAEISLFLGFILVGVALGMIMSLVTYSIVRRRRDFASMTQMLADHYEVRVQTASLAKARQVLGSERVAAPRPTVDLSKPPQFGERIPAPGAVPAPAPAPPAPAPAPPAPAPEPPAAPDAPESAKDAGEAATDAGEAGTDAGEQAAPSEQAAPRASEGSSPEQTTDAGDSSDSQDGDSSDPQDGDSGASESR